VLTAHHLLQASHASILAVWNSRHDSVTQQYVGMALAVITNSLTIYLNFQFFGSSENLLLAFHFILLCFVLLCADFSWHQNLVLVAPCTLS
jgi:hypothetical protein